MEEINYTLDKRISHNQLNVTHVNQSKFEVSDISSVDGKFIEKERIIKFYIRSASGCNVDINDTIIYSAEKLKSPVEHKIIDKFHGLDYNISPKGVYSDFVDIEYFGFSKKIKTFSTFFKTPNAGNKTYNTVDSSIEYIYTVRNLIQSFSDFRNDSSYDNITLNYNLISWEFKNENYDMKPQKLKIEFYFDLGEYFQHEKFNISLPMNKTVISKPYGDDIARTVVKFTNSEDILLKFNQPLMLNFTFPLYFENCKNYNLNFLVVLTGFMLIGFIAFVLYRIILIIFEDEKDDIGK